MPGHDVVIGYHPDDDWDDPPKPGWVTQFCKFFTSRLRQMGLRPPAECWSFGDVLGNQRVTDTQSQAIRDTRVFIAIYSLLYNGPDETYSQHWTALQQALGPDDFSTRLFPVYKLPPDPPPSRSVRGYTFWSNERHPLEYTSDSREFRERINELAFDVAEVLKKLRAITPLPGVFLASAPPSLDREREELRTWLRAQRIKLYPEFDRSPALNRDQYGKIVDDDLDRCELAIHLLGPNDGPGTPQLEGQSPVAIEYYRTRFRINNGRIAAIAWCPPKLVNREDAPNFGVLGDLFGRPSSSFDNLIGEPVTQLHH